MSQRATDLLLALAGVLIVTALALLGYDIWRAARRGPRWRRRLVGAGLALLVSLGVVSCSREADVITCYAPAPLPISQQSAKRLRERIALLEKLSAQDKLDRAVVRKAIDAAEAELANAQSDDGEKLDAKESAALREEVWQKIVKLRQRLEASASGSTAGSKVASMADADGWKRLTVTWREASEIASGKRGAYPFDARGKKRVLAAVDAAVADVVALAKTGLLSEAEAGLLKLDLAELKAGVQAKRPIEMRMATCYEPMMMTPARDSLNRLKARTPLIEKLAAAETVQPAVVGKVLAAVERDLATLAQKKTFVLLPMKEQPAAQKLCDALAQQVATLKARLSAPSPDPQQ